MSQYKIVRMFFNENKRRRTVATGLTVDEAKTHCNDLETSSSTCTSSAKRAYTRKHGPWFDGYEAL